MNVDELDRTIEIDWPAALHGVFRRAGVRLVSYVPDAGHTALINLCLADDDIVTNVLTTEEEGIAISTGAWLGGTRAAILMQSSGVGNCINMLSLPVITRTPLLMLVTMRGEWAEFNPWQNPMGQATRASLEAIGLTVMRADTATDVIETVDQATTMAYDGDQQIAVLVGQRLLGKKQW
ncbi:MAG: pyruvate flavodoxin/ferredoxin oxidoreductase, thiamine diP-bdg family protein [Ilumatobacteraceae bacterium]|nr:pyruvate flavodoxin/ferredoxin oxidoreductase, thiamine diP-bdg family protein [Ilumatobacteraceae bacterium]